ncbi:MAG TPA: hypothetical protein PLP83_02185 [Candidatus Aminicenantes bacterium]|nr:hypothetical protein [Candidatus Aminicenantes bacterium]
MRKWLLLLLAIAILFALPKLNTRGRRDRFPLLKRIDAAVTVAVAVLLAIYLYAFLRWLLSR